MSEADHKHEHDHDHANCKDHDHGHDHDGKILICYQLMFYYRNARPREPK